MVEIENKLKKIFSLVLRVPVKSIKKKSNPENISNWDSLAHMNLILAIEQSFGIKFNSKEIPELFSFESILLILKKK